MSRLLDFGWLLLAWMAVSVAKASTWLVRRLGGTR